MVVACVSSKIQKALFFHFFFLITLCLFALLTSALLFHGEAFCAQVTLAWDPENAPGLAGYKIHYGTVSKNYSFTTNAGTQTTATITGLTEGATYYFSATAYNTAGTESVFSNEVAYTVPSSCSYMIAPASNSFTAAGGTGSVTVSTQSTCSWATANPASWITITSGASGKGNGTVNYSVSANTASSSRTAAWTLAGPVFTVAQAGLPQYTITASPGAGGSITPSGSITVAQGGSQSFTVTSSPGYSISDVQVDGSSVGAVSSYTFVNVTASHSISATFMQKSYTITASANSGGRISPSGTVNVPYGSAQAFTISRYPGYTIADVKVDGVSVGAVTSYSFSNVSASHTIAANFAGNTYTLSIARTGTGTGTVTNSPSGATFAAGTSVTLTATPDSSSTFAGWSGACSGTSLSCTVTMNSNVSVTATFTPKSYSITSTKGTGGSISPLGTITVAYGASQTFTIARYPGYTIADVKVDGVSVGAVSSYTFPNVSGNHSIEATFK